MSLTPGTDPEPLNPESAALIRHVIVPRMSDVQGLSVRRALPARETQMVGPFIFFDEFGPAEFLVGQGLDISPHPHIGLSTVTYLFDGELVHRDSLGTEQLLKPRALNLMTAGQGIVHSERTGAEARHQPQRLFGLQAWAALPKTHEEGAPAFAHVPEEQLPRIAAEGKTVRVVMGELYGARSPASFPHETFYAEAILAPGAVLPLDAGYEERAVYIISGSLDIAGDTFGPGRLLVFHPGDRISLLALSQCRLMLLGGEPMDGPRHIWWNFVSSSKDRILAAEADWMQGRFSLVPGDPGTLA